MASTAATPLYLPFSLSYPLTIQRILATRDSQVTKTQALFSYSYYSQTEGQRERQVAVWESPVQGVIARWAVQEGQQVKDASQPVVYVSEPCTHDVQLHGLCALCGKDLTGTDYTGFSDTSRAAISMVHDVGGLTVSLGEAHRLETATTNRLLGAKKLSLIVDLDQTIVHATVDPTVGDWKGDKKNPNYKVLEDVQRFKLGNNPDESSDDGCWYYVKMRPGLKDFLTSLAEIYEMHVYTMGTRAYAIEVCKVIDPEGKFFGARILSRDESGSMTRKNLQRLFPCDTNMVVIIDDRADVWDGSPNLVKVIPYEFFVGIGDINAAFLPKKKELTATPPGSKPADSSTSSSSAPSDGASTAPTSPADSVTISDLLVDPAASASDIISPSLSEAEASTALTIHDQIESRPLEKAQNEADRSASAEDEDEDDEEEEEMVAVLKDDDVELDRLFKILKGVRDEFFAEVAAGGSNPDVKIIIPNTKRRVLAGVNLVLSGLVALGTQPQDSEYWKLATTFGAKCAADLHSEVTHVVAKDSGTAKVHAARRIPRIKVVWTQWLLDSVAYWTRLPEAAYLVDPASFLAEEPTAPFSPLRPPVSDDEGEVDSLNEAFDIDDLDWGDAGKEVDDFLNETDDDDDDGGGTDGEGSNAGTDDEGRTSSAGGSKKRGRAPTDSEDEGSNGKSKTVEGWSPLQKRVKTSRARKSGLKVSFPAGDLDGESTDAALAVLPAGVASRTGSVNGSAPPSPLPQPTGGGVGGADGYEASQASSSLDSDDEAFFASMAAEVEKGWT